jgi:ornithine carrier protein
MAENACLFFTYSELQNVVGRLNGKHTSELSLPQLAVAAAGAGAITSTIL